MTSAVTGLIPLLAAGENKAPFYVAAGLLVAWAILLAVVGIRSAEFPGGLGRGVLAVSALLVAGVMITAVVTASKPVNAHEAAAGAAKPAGTTPAATSTQPSSAAPASGTVSLAADPSGELKYDTATLSAKAGKVIVNFTNASPVPHNFTIQQGGKDVTATKTFSNGKASASTTLKPGTYTFLCTVDSHAQAGMKGTLTVK